MSNPLVSVIVPVYNGKEYLAECVDSLLGQTYTNREIILVDDGSTDSSGAICDRYAAEHADVRVVHQANGGISEARNKGIEIAKGDFICFVDADDVALPNMIATLLGLALETGSSMVQGQSVITGDVKGALQRRTDSPAIHCYSGDEAIALTLYQTTILPSPWGNLYTRELWETLRFRKGIRYEDLDICYRVMALSETVVVTTEPVYVYRQHDESFIHKFTSSRLDVLDVTDRMLQWIMTNRPELEEAARTRRLSAHVNILGLLAVCSADMPDVHQRCVDVIAHEASRCRRNPLVKRSLRIAMWIYRLGSIGLLEKVLKYGYKIRERHTVNAK